MFNNRNKEKLTYGIVGIGRFGCALAVELAASGADLIVLDCDEKKVRQMREYTDNAYVVSNLDKSTLAETGIQNCDVAVVCIGEHMDMSILTALNLVSMGIPKVIAKAKSAEHGVILEKLGAEVVFPERDMAIRLAHRLEASRVLDFVQLSEKINVSKIHVPDRLIGKTVLEANIRTKLGLNIIAIENGKNVIDNIKPDYVFKENDIIYVCGSSEGLNKLNDWLV